MTNNDVLRTLRYVLHIGEAGLVEIFRLGGCEVVQADVAAFLNKEGTEEFRPCPDSAMAAFLNGLVIYKRGADPTRPPQPILVPVTNNTVLKKVRVAFALKDSDIINLIAASGLVISKAELGAFFRLPDHRNYRECGDQFLRYLLKGLATENH